MYSDYLDSPLLLLTLSSSLRPSIAIKYYRLVPEEILAVCVLHFRAAHL